MTRRDWIAASLFVVAVVATIVTIAVVLNGHAAHHDNARFSSREANLCYPNPGNGGC